MKPSTKRFQPWSIACLGVCMALPIGCTSPLLLTSSSSGGKEARTLAEVTPEPERDDVLLVKDVSKPWGLNYTTLEGVALVTGLSKTGSDPPPSPQRAALLSDMQTYEVKNPNMVLASAETSLVLVRCFLPPGVRKGDRCDVEVRVPSKSETSSLRGGWLMRARLRQVALVDSTLHSGHVEGLAEGHVLVDALFDGQTDKVRESRGRVLGGGIALASRSIGLVVESEQHSIRTSSQAAAAINSRFHTYDRGIKRGVATPKRDDFIELDVHPRYRHNLVRYVRIIQNIAVSESPVDRVHRLEQLERKLLEPNTAPAAALQLEAIGKEAVRVLQKGLSSGDPEVRFYAAESLAYLDDATAADELARTARDLPAFRWHAIAALAAMDHVGAYDALERLFHVSSAETRYAAFRALRMKNPLDPLVRGRMLGDEFSYHTLDTTGPAMVHLSRSRAAEIVVFGQNQELAHVDFLYAGKNILLKDSGDGRIKVSRFAPGEEDRQQFCTRKLDDIVQTLVQIGGGYDEVVEFFQDAKRKECLAARVVVDALPRLNRERRSAADNPSDEPSSDEASRNVASPLPDMFRENASPGGDVHWEDGERTSRLSPDISPDAAAEDDQGVWTRVKGWFRPG